MRNEELEAAYRSPGRRHSREARWLSQRLRASSYLREACHSRDKALRYSFGRRTRVKFRPDGLFLLADRSMVMEFDEHQHAQYKGRIEESRTLRIARAIRNSGNCAPCVFVRFNPDVMKTREGGGPSLAVRNSVFDRCIQTLRDYTPPGGPVFCLYFFYDASVRSIARSLPQLHIRGEGEVSVLGERLLAAGWSRVPADS
jgi:hypothetical protein